MDHRNDEVVPDVESDASIRPAMMPLSVFELSLDASSDIAGLTIAVQSLSAAVKEIRVDIYSSFASRWEEDTVPNLFSALGLVPKLLKIEFYGLRIFPYKIPIAMVERTLSRAVHLEDFCLVGVNLSADQPDEFTEFSETLRRHPAMKAFSLDNCRRSDAFHGSTLDEAIVRVLVQIPTLEKVVIRAMEARMWGIISCASVGLLCSSSTLKSLELCVFSNDDDSVMAEMAKSLIRAKDQSQLTELSVSGSLGGMVGAEAISEMLSINTSLKSLELHLRSRSEDDESGIIQISYALAKNKTLASFQLHGATAHSCGSWDARKAYLRMLQTNYSLHDSVLIFHPTFLRPDNEYYSKLNRFGRGRLLENSNIGRDEWVDTLIKVRDDLDCIYYFLKAQPSLCSSSSMEVSATQKHTDKTTPIHLLLESDGECSSPRHRKRLRSRRSFATPTS